MTHKRGYCSACGAKLGLPCWRGTVQTRTGEVDYALHARCAVAGGYAALLEHARAAA